MSSPIGALIRADNVRSQSVARAMGMTILRPGIERRPGQFRDLWVGSSDSPERELAAAVIGVAAHDLRTNRYARRGPRQRLYVRAYDWLTSDERATTLAAIRTEARRLNRILSDFLHFAKPQEAQRVTGDIRQVVEHVSGLIRDDRARASRVDVKVAVDPMVPRFAFDRDQLTQVLWNVALNGVEAMNGRGRLSMEVGRQNGGVVLAVSDTGSGISSERLPRVFEPFYSGKPNGSGLGLTIAERIVAAHGGRIEIDSELGRGTRVTLLFPLEAA